MKKRGELTTQQIVMLVIAITSFLVLLFFFGLLDFGGESESQICRNSVAMKGGSIISSEASTLNCKRKYLCLTEDGTCEGLTNPEVKKVKTEKEIYAILANEMADCWWMFGEGKINYVGDDFTKNNYCSICSQIMFDDSLGEIPGIDWEISKDKLYDYLSTKNMSNNEMTYAEYIFGTNDLNVLRQKALEEYGTGATFGKIDLGKQYFVIMGITSETNNWKWVALGTAAVAAVVTIPLSVIPTILIVGVAGGAGAGAGIFADSQDVEIASILVEGRGVSNQFMAPTILEVDSNKFDSLSCEEIVTYS
jgi:hypothetical protein